MKTFEEIKEDVDLAMSTSDAEALLRYATELDALDTPQAAALASRYRGWVYYLRGDYTAAMELYLRALTLYEELGERSGVARVTGNIGLVYSSTGDYPVALEHFYRSLALYDELGDRSGVAGVMSNIGVVHERTGNYPEALSQFLRALALCEETGHRPFAANITGNIGLVHERTGNYPEALSHFLRALALHEELGNRSGVAFTKGNIGLVHQSTGNYPEALCHSLLALALHEELGDRLGVFGTTCNIVATYIAMGSDAEAQALLQTMDDMQIDEPRVRIEREQHLATLLERSGDLGGATATLQRALAEASEHGLRSLAADTHKALRDLAQKRNDFAGYIEHNNEFTRITEEIKGKEATLKIAMQTKQRELDAERKEHEKQIAVLHSTLPKHIADRVARGEVVTDHFDNAAVLFLDVVGFTNNSALLEAGEVVELLQNIFTTFDSICAKHNITKIKTIGDAYMAVAFPVAENGAGSFSPGINLPDNFSGTISPGHFSHHVNLASASIEIINSKFTWSHNSLPVEFRIGLHCGPVVAGVLGTETTYGATP